MLKLQEMRSFGAGLMIGSLMSFLLVLLLESRKTALTEKITRIHEFNNQIKFDDSLALELFNSQKVLCMVLTSPSSYRDKADHIKLTWGKKCHKLIFMSHEEDDFLDIGMVRKIDDRHYLWMKTRESFKYVYENYLKDFDWFLKADDDSYLMMENLHYMLSQYNPKTAFYFGHRYLVSSDDEGYMAGGAYVLSQKALKKFQEKLVYNATICKQDATFAEDYEMGKCLMNSAIFVDCRDELHQKRFFPAGVTEHMGQYADPEYWYTRNQYYRVPQGSTNCCSSTAIHFHYIPPHEMYLFDYFTYEVHPFGLKSSEDVLPEKLLLKDIIAASDVPVPSVNYINHTDVHNMGESEVY